ncbi:TPA: DUF551 domain-containing protein [Escherichia coli]|uniref:DUF551 domain-containing protein n=1 Tax=Escherichia coli TaxID=562 RepID=UPI0009427FA8|nr:DUF551 domain-containing protein [Escherichia coli]EFK3236831.1 DUF551 domain-containing protein [Escherichia coli]HAU9264447.1 DUF551 domain-containing protein [Escherichia coli]HAU9701834.1 DUF551 domain-containing protein [Escherichia coli]HAX2919426.1 DUF551 domain-containing protein [Escherichia coli]HAX3024648.1 DUF551 domain-containing protein [Escherichia coli]
MKFSKFSELVNRILSNNHSHRRDMDVTIVVHSPGSIGSTPSVEVQSIHAGFDWDSGKVLIFPAQPLTTLTPEQITDITDSVRKGQSWHAYQEYKKHKEQLEKLSIELDAAKQRIAELKAEPVSQTYKLNQISGNSPVTTDGWISCSERMPDTKTAVLVAREFDRKGDWRMKWATYIPGHPDANDGWVVPGASWIPSHWMPLPEPPQEVNRG